MSDATESIEQSLEADQRARVDVYRLLGRLLTAPPDTELLDVLSKIQLGDEADGGEMTQAWQDLKSAASAASQNSLTEEYFNIFIGVGRGELLPYASFYIHGFLMEKVLASLREEMARLGIERKLDVAEPEDHAGAICEMMAMMISAQESEQQQSDFFSDYVASWMIRFFEELGEAESAEFYRVVAQLGSRFLAVEQRYFSLPE